VDLDWSIAASEGPATSSRRGTAAMPILFYTLCDVAESKPSRTNSPGDTPTPISTVAADGADYQLDRVRLRSLDASRG
jgi:hypothetical protein